MSKEIELLPQAPEDAGVIVEVLDHVERADQVIGVDVLESAVRADENIHRAAPTGFFAT